jgi:hypothetical protein
VLAGDLAIFTVLDILVAITSHILDTSPRILAFYTRLASHPSIKTLVQEVKAYYTLPQDLKEKEGQHHVQEETAVAPKLFYWGFKARGYYPAVIAAYAGFDLNWIKDIQWPGEYAMCSFLLVSLLVFIDN